MGIEPQFAASCCVLDTCGYRRPPYLPQQSLEEKQRIIEIAKATVVAIGKTGAEWGATLAAAY